MNRPDYKLYSDTLAPMIEAAGHDQRLDEIRSMVAQDTGGSFVELAKWMIEKNLPRDGEPDPISGTVHHTVY